MVIASRCPCGRALVWRTPNGIVACYGCGKRYQFMDGKPVEKNS